MPSTSTEFSTWWATRHARLSGDASLRRSLMPRRLAWRPRSNHRFQPAAADGERGLPDVLRELRVWDAGLPAIRCPTNWQRAKKEGEGNMISAAFPYQKQRRQVLGSEMAYAEVGEGDPIVLLHGNPTSSYLWRNILPYLQPLGRCIAPDLIGMGDSAKLPNSGPGSYRFVEHRRFFRGLLQGLGMRERVTLVVHDWGPGLGFDWANRHREAVKGIAHMEAIVRPQDWTHWDTMGARPILQQLRSEAGEKLMLQEHLFIETFPPKAIKRTLSAEEKAE